MSVVTGDFDVVHVFGQCDITVLLDSSLVAARVKVSGMVAFATFRSSAT